MFVVKFRVFMCILIDILLVSSALYFINKFRKYWPPTPKRGFFCDDETLKYPYKPDTVDRDMLTHLSRNGPGSIVLLAESAIVLCVYLRKRRISLWPLYRAMRCFLYGYIAVTLLKNIGKMTVGRLRPHFFEVCKPVFADNSTCATHAQDGVYHLDYKCTGHKHAGITEGMIDNLPVSFPSGHASLMFYGMIFLVCYIQLRLKTRHSALAGWFKMSLILPMVQLLCIIVAWYVALSRVVDYKHHWSDVVAGSLLGTAVAYISTNCLLKERTDVSLGSTKHAAEDLALQTVVTNAHNGAN